MPNHRVLLLGGSLLSLSLIIPGLSSVANAAQVSEPVTTASANAALAKNFHTYSKPPAGFNPLTASAAQLKMYGFPARPTNSQELTQWNHAMSLAKTSVTPGFKLNPNVKAPFCSGTSTNWSGYSMPAQSGQSFYETTLQWYVPTPTVYYNGGSAFSSAWAGIGGCGGSQALIQAGTESDTGIGSADVPYAWWEILPANQVTITQFSPSFGDEMYEDISVSPATVGVSFYVEDETTGAYASFSESYAGTNGYDPSTANWIMERTCESGSIPPLADYGSDTFSDAGTSYTTSSGGSGFVYAGDQSPTNVAMVDDNGQTLSTAGSIGSLGTFGMTWQNFGDYDGAC